MVISNAKQPTTIVGSVLVFGNSCTIWQLVGFAVTIGGVYCYQSLGKEVDPGEAKMLSTSPSIRQMTSRCRSSAIRESPRRANILSVRGRWESRQQDLSTSRAT